MCCLLMPCRVGNAIDNCPYGCIWYQIVDGVSLSGSKGADGMASILAHELAEAASSPLVSSGQQSEVTQWNAPASWALSSLVCQL
jgi:hypothetical protein